jgi:acyl-[acyl-carrier protein] desaturase
MELMDRYSELLNTISPTVEDLVSTHRERRSHWYAHEHVPWEEGRNYRTEPWDPSQGTLAPEVRTALVLNLLTEDNLPYYHAELGRYLPEDSVFTRWQNLWTAEENQHAIAIRSYLLVSRNCDPVELEDDRLATMERGYQAEFDDPIEVFVYTAAQELATRVSHRNAGKLADDPVAYDIMSRIATDENHHYLFYRGVVEALLKVDPELVLPAIQRVLSSFHMPGMTAIPGFARRALSMAKSGVYNLRVHHDRVVAPLLRDFGIEKLSNLGPAAAEAQQDLLALPKDLVRRAEAFERRYGLAGA